MGMRRQVTMSTMLVLLAESGQYVMLSSYLNSEFAFSESSKPWLPLKLEM